ncbi:hypothetical protein QBC42DRAFT_253416 [Cladorrhinum samala]|uniref:Uncharacterized protein n=1 Tax=Cladorrhinum samala TaxID=585594 RepID=A0AAV9HJ81_9PEZI|nr:hypothetical protein QBC42DRAFT_253416 [Cladorrhinum samala]
MPCSGAEAEAVETNETKVFRALMPYKTEGYSLLEGSTVVRFYDLRLLSYSTKVKLGIQCQAFHWEACVYVELQGWRVPRSKAKKRLGLQLQAETVRYTVQGSAQAL